MCGIFGYWARDRAPLADGLLRTTAQKLIHRGPDDEGIWHQPQRGVAIGNRRLSIIDIGGGHQPFVSEDGQVAVVQNGEIFNFIELANELRSQGVQLKTASDTEVILRLYERDGIGFVSKLNGMFSKLKFCKNWSKCAKTATKFSQNKTVKIWPNQNWHK